MNKKILRTILVLILGVFSFVLLNPPFQARAEDVCPGMDDNSQECLDYLRDKQTSLSQQQSNLQQSLKDEEYQQLSLSEKITYITTQVTETEKVIEVLELEIKTNDVQIKLLEKDIQESEDYVSLMRQETTQLEKTVNQRVTESYKYSFVGAMEIFLDSNGLGTILRKVKYLASTRQQDKDSLEKFTTQIAELEEEEKKLEEDQAELQLVRNKLEDDKTELFEEKQALSAQRAEKDKLLAESEARELAYQTQLKDISSQINSVTKNITDLIFSLFQNNQLPNGSEVKKGDTIGFEGHTGCSFGSHLHFEIRSNGVRVNPLQYYSLSGNYLYAKTYPLPLNGAYLTQGYHGGHLAIDLVSLTQGYQGYDRYTVPYGLCPIVDSILNCRRYGYGYCSNSSQPPVSDWNKAYKRGEGAPLLALDDGIIYYGVDSYGGKWALVDQDDGRQALYVHLQ